jgi:hypothetical protein
MLYSEQHRATVALQIFIFVLLLKIILIPHDDLIGQPDETVYVTAAQNIAHHGVLSKPSPEFAPKLLPPKTPPLYSLTLVPAALLDVEPLSRQFYFFITNAILCSLAVFPLLWIAVYFRVRNAAAAVSFAALSGPLTAYVAVNLSENLFTTAFLFSLSAYIYYFKCPNFWRALVLAISFALVVLTRKAGLFVLPPFLLGLLVYFSAEGHIRMVPISKLIKRSAILVVPCLAYMWTSSYKKPGFQTVESYTIGIIEQVLEAEGAWLVFLRVVARAFYGQFGFVIIWCGGIFFLCTWVAWRARRDTIIKSDGSEKAAQQTSQHLLAPAAMLTLLTVGVITGGVLHCIKGGLAGELATGVVARGYTMYSRYADPAVAIAWLFIAAVVLGKNFDENLKKHSKQALLAAVFSIAFTIGIVLYVLHYIPPKTIFAEAVRGGHFNATSALILSAVFIVFNVTCCFYRRIRWVPLASLLVLNYFQIHQNIRTFGGPSEKNNFKIHENIHTFGGPSEIVSFRTQAFNIQKFDRRTPIHILSVAQKKSTWYDHGPLLTTFFEQVVPVFTPQELFEQNPNNLYFAYQHIKFYRVGELMEMISSGELDLLGALGEYYPGSSQWKLKPESRKNFKLFKAYSNAETMKMPRPHPGATVWNFTLAPQTTLYQDIPLPFDVTPGGIGRGAAHFFWSKDADWRGIEMGVMGGNADISDFSEGTFVSVGKVTTEPRLVTLEHKFTSFHKTMRFAIRNTSDAPITFRIGKPAMYYERITMRSGESVRVDRLTRINETNPVVPANPDRAYISKTPLNVTFIIEEAGTYQLEGLFHGIGGNNDSYWLKTKFGDRSKKTWHTPRQPLNWSWAKAPAKWALKPGEYQFSLIPREETPLAAIRINRIPDESP